jgi:tetratricopeptide (TPR) repeat protein
VPPVTKQSVNTHPSYPHPLELICQSCGKQGKYRVGRICLDPEMIFDPRTGPSNNDDAFFFTSLFRCRHCGADGPWGFTPMTKMALIALMALYKQNPDESPLLLGVPTLFDGTILRSPFEREAHLKKLVEAAPHDDFLRERLGNLYLSADENDLARACFEKALELNPNGVEALHSLAVLEVERGDPGTALGYFRQILQRCRHAPARSAHLLRELVIDTLYYWGELQDPDRALSTLPPFNPAQPGGDGTIPRNVLRGRDLENDGDVGFLADIYLSGRLPTVPEHRPSTRPFVPPLPAQAAAARRVGRNDPCPCGSGKKFKKCCGQHGH